MSDFSQFDEAISYYNNLEKKEKNTDNSDKQDCIHENTITEKGVNICIDCGEELSQKITNDKEWRYYPNSEKKNINETNLKKDDRTIFKDLENLTLSDTIKIKANSIYTMVTSNKDTNSELRGKILRGNSRKGIIFACTYHAFKLANIPQSYDRLLEIFNLERKDGLKGLKFVNLNAPKKSEIRTTYIKPTSLLNDIMIKFNATEEQKNEVNELYKKIENRSSPLNRSRPQSVASGLVYYWILLKKKDISLKDFAKKVELSELTISKITKLINDILQLL